MRINATLSVIVSVGIALATAAGAKAGNGRLATDTDDQVILQPTDLQAITALVLEEHPELASSPGIKMAEAYRFDEASYDAFVLFYPHTETGGIKQALQIECSRLGAGQPWSCEPAEIRRYLRVENQEFEVRVVGDIGSMEALAVVAATRAGLPLYLGDGPADSCQAIIMRPAQLGYKLQWSCPGRKTALFMHAIPIAGADTTRIRGWQVSEYLFPDSN